MHSAQIFDNANEIAFILVCVYICFETDFICHYRKVNARGKTKRGESIGKEKE